MEVRLQPGEAAPGSPTSRSGLIDLKKGLRRTGAVPLIWPAKAGILWWLTFFAEAAQDLTRRPGRLGCGTLERLESLLGEIAIQPADLLRFGDEGLVSRLGIFGL